MITVTRAGMAKHFQRWLFVIVIHLGAILHDSYGLRCLECQEVFKPEDCLLSGDCGQDELCLTRSFTDAKGRHAYRLGCETTEVCDLYKHTGVLIGKRATGQERPCRQCCSHDNCNEKLCAESATNATLPTSTPARDCLSRLEQGVTSSGVYSVTPDGGTPFNVYCDMTGDKGGWAVVQRRVDDTVAFDKNWNQYKKGFGSLDGNFWLGNDHLHRLTSQTGRNYTLRFELTVPNGTVYQAFYYDFTVASEAEKYRVNFTGYSGNAGDSFSAHNRMQFTTFDSDHDRYEYNCGERCKGGWWYDDCYHVNINGVYGVLGLKGLIWDSLTGSFHTLKATSMAIRKQLSR
ncbi:fibrinogen-like protein A isoform X2 [Haliotis rufescens]|uniref:fibrinogen-like protein A isoform X2 n=1 Tax=Haliotis rufescens TaxID=6454 RepID=UPI00201F3B70|nr:fibrinogen-like protein A isoform X2 [Haliotis rufescens]